MARSSSSSSRRLLLLSLVIALVSWSTDAQSAGFVRSPLSQSLLLGETTTLHCEVVGVPTPEVQWWFAPAQRDMINEDDDGGGGGGDDDEDVDNDEDDGDVDESDDDDDVDGEKALGTREATTVTQQEDIASSSSASSSSASSSSASSSLPLVPWLSVTDIDRDPSELGPPGLADLRGAAGGRRRPGQRHHGRIFSQLWDGDRGGLVSLVTAYGPRGAQSGLTLRGLAHRHAGTYECRASNAPRRNHPRRAGMGARGREPLPVPRWVRAQAAIGVIAHPEIRTSPAVQLSGSGRDRRPVSLRCELSAAAGLHVLGHAWLKDGKALPGSEDDSASLTTTYSIEVTDYSASGLYTCAFHTEPPVNSSIAVNAPLVVEAPHASESADEGGSVSLRCDARTYPPPAAWTWHRQQHDGTMQVIGSVRDGEEVGEDSGTGDAEAGRAVVVVLNGGRRSELRLGPPLVSSRDSGLYVCNASVAARLATGAAEVEEGGVADEGPAWGSGQVSLRVRAHLAALWPFLGIVGEVVLLTGAILVYERRQVARKRLANGAGKAALTPGTTRH
ncbi:basigin-like isoform X2 [Lethenteron reissneri]|uniref:basigin-like isoform X2 n=1 Tax=Lethenteron reissneri TaxID=7753 RepID=UPI002AB6C172|nr:basigin-like isoform X2 [Lethenteron reissneri]